MRTLTGPDGGLREIYAVPRTPWLRVNMISTIDGAATGDTGLTGSINNAPDKVVFDLLRALADAVIVGAGTARAEGYPPLAKPTVVVSRSGRVPEKMRDAEPGRGRRRPARPRPVWPRRVRPWATSMSWCSVRTASTWRR